VLTAASSDEVAAEDAAESEEVRSAMHGGGGAAGVSRKRGSMSALSGGDGLAYAEVNTLVYIHMYIYI